MFQYMLDNPYLTAWRDCALLLTADENEILQAILALADD